MSYYRDHRNHCHDRVNKINKTQGFPRQGRRRKKRTSEKVHQKVPPIAPCSRLKSSRSHTRLKSQPSLYAIATLLVAQIIMANQSVIRGLVSAQIILDHPRNQIQTQLAKPILNFSRPIKFSPPYSIPFHLKQNERLLVQRVKNSRLETSTSVNRTELLKKLSSDRLLEALSRRIANNQTTSSSLGTRLGSKPLLMVENPHESNTKSNRIVIHSDEQNSSKYKSDHDNVDKLTSETALHQSTIIGAKKSDDEEKVPNTSGKSDLFNASSLNYLVEKLLNVDSLKQSTRIPVYPSKRPSPRKKIEQRIDSQSSLDRLNFLKNAPKTLDILIREEYNSRVEPMLQSLLNQQKLSGQQTLQSSVDNPVTKTGPANHKTTEMYSTMSSTSLDPIATSLHGSEPSNILNLSSTITSVSNGDQNTSVDFEDLLDLEGDGESDEPDDDYESTEKIPTSTAGRLPSDTSGLITKGTRLRNVPPYQLSVNFHSVNQRPNFGTEPPETPTTTSSTLNTVTTRHESNSDQKQQGRRNNTNSKTSEREAVATNRGSLVFSDGAEEAMRLNRSNTRKKAQSHLEIDMANPRVKLNSLGSHSGETNLLKQLFSTVRPSRDSQVRLSEHTKVVQKDHLAPNPLVYSGYVGKDDYLISSIASDWSRPLTNRETNTTAIYKYPYSAIGTTTRRPQSNLPTSYSIYQEQPLTNAQTVPSMVIPTSASPTLRFPRPTYPSMHLTDYQQKNMSSMSNQSLHNSVADGSYPNTTNVSFLNETARRDPQASIAILNEKGNAVVLSNNPITSTRHVQQSGNDVYLTKIPKEIPPRTSEIPLSSHISDNMNLNRVDRVSSPPLLSIVGEKSDSNFQRNHGKPPDESRFSTVMYANSESKNTSSQGRIDKLSHAGQRNAPIDTVSLSIAEGKTYSRDGVISHGAPDVSSADPTISLSNSAGNINHTTSDYGFNNNIRKHKHQPDNMNDRREKPYSSMQDYQASESDQHELSSQPQTTPKRPTDPDLFNKSKPHMNSSHEHKGSEILGTNRQDHSSHLRNSTSILNKTSLEVGDDGSSAHFGTNHSTTVGLPNSASAGSTIISNSNFFSEASSESPIYDNSITVAGIDRANKHGSSSPDLYQRIGSVAGGSSVGSSNSIETREVGGNKQSDLNPITTTKTAGKSSDRMAFILIGGSCALSVVCLVFAAMSMRCQDMCDDYRSLRNAERAALKLQKHRLRYTKNHQITRLDAINNSDVSQQDDFNALNGMKQDGSTDKIVDFEAVNSSRCLNAPGNGNSKPLEHVVSNNAGMVSNNGLSNERSPGFTAWNAPNCQVPVSALVHRDGPCGCSNCINYRWIAQNEMLASSKHLSLLHPYYFMQNQSRLKPPFGAGSSVGTFFPRRLEDQSFHGGGSSDAQILVDNHRSHSCHAGLDQRGLLQSKSILQRSKRFHPRHSTRVEPLVCNDVTNLECNNPNHSHHMHKYDLEPSASEESEITVDESIPCDSVKCSLHHQNRYHCHHSVSMGCMKVQHSKSQQSSHHGRSTKAKISQPHHHHHHHHHAHQQPSSSSDTGSIAQCTCNRDQQPLIFGNHTRQQSTRLKVINYKQPKHDSRASVKRHGKRDKSFLVWSTNRDQLI